MTEAGSADGGAAGAGTLLRAAREKQGLHIAVLASLIKVAPAKLEALECERFDELPDATFTRALAQTVCRTLKIDPRPVLDLLPSAGQPHLEKVGAGLHMPFRESVTHSDPGEWSLLGQPVFWLVLLLLGSAAAFWFWPASMSKVDVGPGLAASAPVPAQARTMPAPAPASVPGTEATAKATPAPAAVAAAAAASVPVLEAVHSSPGGPGTAAANDEKLAKAMLVLRASEPSWVEVIDGREVLLLSRVLQSGEAIGLDARLPVKVRVGNAPATRLSFRGRDVELRASGKDNVARVELK